MHTVPQRALTLDCEPGLCGLNQVYGPNHPTPYVKSICGKYINIFTRCTIMNQHAIVISARYRSLYAMKQANKWFNDHEYPSLGLQMGSEDFTKNNSR